MLALTSESKRLLKLLESNRDPRLFEINTLEMDLDECVVEFSNLLPELTGAQREYAIEHLKSVRDYRRRHPWLETGDAELHQRARKILDKFT